MTERIFPVTLYKRDRGVICYEVGLWHWACYLPTQLLSSDLTWLWSSCRDRPTSEQSPVQGLPEKRDWTWLEGINQSDLIDDFHERTIDGEGRFILLLGFEPGFVKISLPDEVINDSLKAFIEEQGTIQVVVVSHEDSVAEFVFVWHEDRRPPAVSKLLETWHLTTLPPTKTFSYDRLRTARLEQLLSFHDE